MPILPLDHPEPLAAVLGVMLYPGTDEESRRRARAFASRRLREPIRDFYAAGGTLSNEVLVQLHAEADEDLDDLNDRIWDGTVTGEIVKALFALAHTGDGKLASWGNATKIAEALVGKERVRGSRTLFYDARSRCASVAHLWGAFCLRDRRFLQDPSVGYDAWDDLQVFLAEAETLRQWGRSWKQDRAKAEPPFPAEAWTVPGDWEPPQPQPGWPRDGRLQAVTLEPEWLKGIGKPGRPRKRR